jgi:hypothetical protein
VKSKEAKLIEAESRMIDKWMGSWGDVSQRLQNVNEIESSMDLLYNMVTMVNKKNS